MYGTRSTRPINPHRGTFGRNQSDSLRPLWLGVWGLLWVLCAQVDILTAQSTTWAMPPATTGKDANNRAPLVQWRPLITIKLSSPADGWSTIQGTSNLTAGNNYQVVLQPTFLSRTAEYLYVNGAWQPTDLAASGTYTISFYKFGAFQFTKTISYNNTGILTYQAGGSMAQILNFEPMELSINPLTGDHTWTDPNTPPPPDNLEQFEGEDLTIPYYVSGDAETVEVTIGGQTLTFPVDHTQIEGGGIATLNLPIPDEWDGTATIGGVQVALAPRMAYTGVPAMNLFANPYLLPDSPLPVGMSRAILPVPNGMTATQWYSLPSGVSTNPYNTLPFPLGIQSIWVPQMVNGTLPVGVTTTSGTSSWTTSTSGTAPSGTVTTGGPNTVTTNPNPLGQDDADAVTDSGLGSPDGDTEAGAGLKDFPNRWLAAKSAIENKIGGFNVLASGSIPKATVLNFTLPLGIFGQRVINLDLTQEPFATARLLALVFVTFWAGMWFIKFLKV